MKPIYEVGWYSKIPVDANGDSDFDSAVVECRRFPNLGLARAFAAKVIVGLPIEAADIHRIEEVSATECDELAWWFESGKRLAYIGDTEAVYS